MFDPFLISLLLIAALAISGASVGLSVMAGSFFYLILRGLDPSLATESMLQGLFNGYTLLAIPLFILAAEIMNIGSLSDRLLKFTQSLVGRFRGGLGYVNVVTSVIFAGMSGSAVADASGMGKMIINLMTRDGKYTPEYAAAITAATATVGPIIPPSIPMVLYALVADQSVGFLFAAGMLPGLMMALSMGFVNYYVAKKQNFPIDDSVPLSELPARTINAMPALMLPVILLGGIYSGWMSPTQAAAIAALYALIVSWVFYRSVSFREFYEALLSSARSTASVGVLIAGALAFEYVIAREQIAKSIGAWITAIDPSANMFLAIVLLLILALGCLLEGGVILLIIVPILIPAAESLGIDLVHFGVVVVVCAMIGLITPPFGLLLFVTSNITKTPIALIIKAVWPFIIALIFSLLIITFVPDFVLFVPRQLGYGG